MARTLPTDASPKVVALEGYNHQALHTRGLRLHAVTAGSPSGPLVVLVHDGFGCWADFRRMLAPLAARGYHVAAIDMRGYGMSDKPPHGYTFRHATGDIAGAIRTLGHDRAHVVGMGVGGTIAWVLATSHPDHVASITSVDGFHPSETRRATLLRPWRNLDTLAIGIGFRLPRLSRSLLWGSRQRLVSRHLRNHTSLQYQQSPLFHEDLEMRLRALSIASTAQAVAKTFKLQLDQLPPKWLGLKVACPVQVIIDSTAHSGVLTRLAQRRATGTFLTSSVPGARLCPQLEAPEEFALTIDNFLRAYA